MKTTSLHKKLGGLIRPGSLGAVVMISGFWASLMLAVYFVTGALIGVESKLAASLYFGLFAVFFFLHSFGPWSKLAAVLGFCSLAVMAVFFWYLGSPDYLTPIPSVLSAILLTATLGFVGIFLDAEKYRKWLARTHRKSSSLFYDYSI